MIISFATKGPLFADTVELHSSDGTSKNKVLAEPLSFATVNPKGPGPWSLTIGSSTAVAEIDEADSVVVYGGQNDDNFVTTRQ